MAIRLIEEYPNRVGAPTADYPHGVPRNKSTPTATDGTPFEQSWFRDQEGFFQGLMETAGITPSGQPDTVLNSDYLDALNRVTNGVIEVDMAGAADVSLSAYQGRVAALKLTGALAADVDLIVPDTERLYTIIDETTGSFSVTVRTELGSGVVISGETSIVRCDGSDAVDTLSVGDAVLRQELGSSEEGSGAALVSMESGESVEDAISSITTFVENEAQLEAAISRGRKNITLRPGDYEIKNLVLDNITLTFMDGARLVCRLNSQDNGIVVYSNVRLHNPKILVENLEPIYNGSGAYGNAVIFGDYTTGPDDEYKNNVIDNISIETLSSRRGHGISFFGDSSATIGKVELLGDFSIGILAHWGGDVSPEDPHNGLITYSTHPNNVYIESVEVLKKPSGNGAYTGVYLSAVYNFHIGSIVQDGGMAILRVTPGDLYEQVTVERQRGRILQGIRVGSALMRNPQSGRTGELQNLAEFSGLSLTPRTGQPGVLTSVYNTGPADVKVGKIVVVKEGGESHGDSPLLRFNRCVGFNVNFEAYGFDSEDCYGVDSLFSILEGCSFKFATRRGSRILGSRLIDTLIECAGDSSGLLRSGVSFNDVSHSVTLASPLSVGSTSVSISHNSSVFINEGAYLSIGGQMLRVNESYMAISGSTRTVSIARSDISAQSGTSANIRIIPSGSARIITSGYLYGVSVEDAKNLSIDVESTRCGKYDIRVSPGVAGVDALNINAKTMYGGQLNDGTLMASVVIESPAKNVSVRGEFEVETSGLVRRNVQVYEGCSSIKITGCSFRSTLSPVDLPTQDQASVEKGRNQCYGNTVHGGGQETSDQLSGMLSEGRFIGRGIAAPTSGYWRTGDTIFRLNPSSGATQGWACTSSGTPGTWALMPNLQ